MPKAFTALLAWIFLSFSYFAKSNDTQIASKPSDDLLWQGYVRNFRLHHHFGFSLGHSQSRWDIEPFNRSYHLNTRNSGVYLKWDYTFHIPLWQGFGYFLGSSAGTLLQERSYKDNFNPSSSIHFPSIRCGGVWNLSPVWRFSVGLDLYLERLNQLSWQKNDQQTTLSVTMLSQDGFMILEMFYKLNLGIRAQIQKRTVTYQSPQSGSKGKVIDANIARKDLWLGLGLVYHLL